jgi:pyridinium-3,5-biscarboxylic acid mononucleotide sulfurtransferase
VTTGKLDKLRELIGSYGSCIVAYSGGVDSAFLALVARQALGNKALAVIADTPSIPRRELQEALDMAKKFDIPVRVVKTHEFANQNYVANSLNRCYFCKSELFSEIMPIAKKEGYAVIAYGENASDVGDHRPGAQAAAEQQVRAPLKEVGMTKTEIRQFSAELGLPTAEKPQMACLSSRIPPGEAVTPEKLKMVEEAEYVLRDLGFYDVRVRHHELRGGQPLKDLNYNAVPKLNFELAQHLARIEVGPAEMRKFLEGDTAAKAAAAIKALGYAHVTLDLQGYRRGSNNGVV